MKKRTTLQDIADYCKLSKSMVAKVVSNPVHCKATARTRELVADAVKKLDYRPNFAARALTTNRTFTVGVLFPSVNSFYDELGVQIDAALAVRGYTAIFAYWNGIKDSQQAFIRTFERMRLRGIDGVVTCQYEESIADSGIPIVTYGNERRLMDCVYPDKLDYATRAVHYLAENGHRRIGFIGFFRDVRYQQICNEMKKLDLPYVPEWFIPIETAHQYEEGCQAMAEILALPRRPTAVITHGDHVAVGALCAAHKAGVAVPDDISLLSYDNLRGSGYCTPPLTTFDQRYEFGAELLVETLIRRIENPTIPQQKFSFSMPLIERESVKNITSNHRG